MLMENHMTLHLPLSGSILNPIDMAQVWRRLKRQWCRHLIPMHENSLFPFFSIHCQPSPGPQVRFPCSLRWTEESSSECGTVVAIIVAGILMPDAMWSQHWAGGQSIACTALTFQSRDVDILMLKRQSTPCFQGAHCTLGCVKSLWWSWLYQVLLSNDLPSLGGRERIEPTQHKQALSKELYAHGWKKKGRESQDEITACYFSTNIQWRICIQIWCCTTALGVISTI